MNENRPKTASMVTAHSATVTFLSVAIVFQLISPPAWLGAFSKAVPLAIFGVMVVLATKVMALYRSAFEQFVPTNKLEARIANEQIRLIATFLNTIATSTFAVFILGRYITDQTVDPTSFLVGMIYVYWMNSGARRVLETLKNEDW